MIPGQQPRETETGLELGRWAQRGQLAGEELPTLGQRDKPPGRQRTEGPARRPRLTLTPVLPVQSRAPVLSTTLPSSLSLLGPTTLTTEGTASRNTNSYLK